MIGYALELKNSPKHHVSGLGYQVDETINWNKDITGDHIKGWKNYTLLFDCKVPVGTSG